jgi:hypothetical protein
MQTFFGSQLVINFVPQKTPRRVTLLPFANIEDYFQRIVDDTNNPDKNFRNITE